MNTNQIITIGRQFGAGGRSIGKELAKRLGVDFYDQELIKEAAQNSGLAHELMNSMDEQHMGSLLYSIVMNTPGRNLFTTGKSVELVAYEAQISAVKNVAEKGPCVIVGRAADCILAADYDIVSFFITAPERMRIAHVAERDGITKEEALKKIVRLDKARASFYNGFSNKKWGAASSYDCCINAGIIGEEEAVKLMQQYILSIQKQKAHSGQ